MCADQLILLLAGFVLVDLVGEVTQQVTKSPTFPKPNLTFPFTTEMILPVTPRFASPTTTPISTTVDGCEIHFAPRNETMVETITFATVFAGEPYHCRDSERCDLDFATIRSPKSAESVERPSLERVTRESLLPHLPLGQRPGGARGVIGSEPLDA